ncbi:hypothetical protein FE257_009430 [Aspergillus nanangensis]|uniref:Integral membrane protein n=1 Tax=Aspergillus nanangensis TaxID=2582783 RepID=A0AAD4GTY3_ASPNN|nr:hypothetical protein FE257_009430 [Aspergillus nanangensis]
MISQRDDTLPTGSTASSMPKCYAFKLGVIQAQVALIAVFTIVYLIALSIFIRRIPRQEKAWIPLVISLVLAIVHAIINLVATPIHYCSTQTYAQEEKYWLILFAAGCIHLWAVVFLVATIMISVCKRLTRNNRWMVILASGYVGVYTILSIASTAIAIRTQIAENISSRVSLYGVTNSLAITQAAIVAAGMSLAVLVMGVSMVKQAHFRRGAISIAIIVLMVSSLGYGILQLVDIVTSIYGPIRRTSTLSLVYLALYRAFFIGCWLGAYYVVAILEKDPVYKSSNA